MTDRITKENVAERRRNVNRRLESRGSILRYVEGYRNGYCALDCYYAANGEMQRHVTSGTKAEVAAFLHAMIVALDDSVVKEKR